MSAWRSCVGAPAVQTTRALGRGCAGEPGATCSSGAGAEHAGADAGVKQ